MSVYTECWLSDIKMIIVAAFEYIYYSIEHGLGKKTLRKQDRKYRGWKSVKKFLKSQKVKVFLSSTLKF